MADTLERLQTSLADRYVIERELGRGGMATVFLARDIRHDREVAIKVLHPDLAATIGSERFEREIRMAAKLQHPHILGLYDSGNAGELLFYVMPYVNGESVRDRLVREKQLPLEDALQIALEVADALGYAHSQNIVHRDIKPENVLLANGHALVADFGIARARSEAGQQKLTQTGMAVGTPVYMSPEQSTGEVVGPTADIYSLGCMLYEMLAGEPPFSGPNPLAIMAKHAMETVPSVRVVRQSVPEEVEEAILAAMEKSPADRPKTAAAFAEIMGAPLSTTAMRRVTMRHTAARRAPTGAQRQLTPAHFEKPWWRTKWGFVAAAVAIAGGSVASWKAVAGGGGMAAVAVDSLSNRVAVLYFADQSANGELRPVADRLTESLIAALGEVPSLIVTSRNGVARFRNTSAAPDSIARSVGVGTLVQGSVEPEGANRVRVTARLLNRDGIDIGDRMSLSVSRDSLFTAEASVAGDVAAILREALGTEVNLRTTRAATSSRDAFMLYLRAEKARKDAAQFGAANRDSALTRFALADSLAKQSEVADGKWIDPIMLQGEIALQRGRLHNQPTADDRAEYERWLQAGIQVVERAVAVDAANGRSLALRGTIRYDQWRLALTKNPAQLDAAADDLERAVKLDPALASAYATLSSVYYDKKDRFQAFDRARKAYVADTYLTNAAFILFRLFWTSYDTEQFLEAAKWCDEAGRRFPADLRFTFCRLWMLTTRDSKPDIGEAWRLKAKVDSVASASERPYQSRLAQIVVGGVIGRAAKPLPAGPQRAALMDSAGRVLDRARDDPSADPRQELPGYEAIMRTLMGDYKKAFSMLQQYVILHPEHSFKVGGNVHWWWRDLRDTPGFDALMAQSR